MPARLRLLSRAQLAVAAAVVAFVVAGADPTVRVEEPFQGWVTGQEIASFHGLDPLDPYAGRPGWTRIAAYAYSPVFAQALVPIAWLPWRAFVGLWTALLLLALRFVAGRRGFLPALAFAAMEIAGGNISLPLAAAIVAGFRFPSAWAVVLLTKVTPGVGLLWFALRREWRPLAIALGTTAALVAISWLLSPIAWTHWIALLTEASGRNGTWAAVPVPLLVRLPIGVALIAWGARTDRPWTLLVGSMLSLPALWYGSLSMLVALPALGFEVHPAAWRRRIAALGGATARG